MASPTEILQFELNGPALAPPPGVTPNFANPENILVVLVVVCTLCIFISTLVFWIRVYARLYIFRETEWEDCISLFRCFGIDIVTNFVQFFFCWHGYSFRSKTSDLS